MSGSVGWSRTAISGTDRAGIVRQHDPDVPNGLRGRTATEVDAR